MYHTSP